MGGGGGGSGGGGGGSSGAGGGDGDGGRVILFENSCRLQEAARSSFDFYANLSFHDKCAWLDNLNFAPAARQRCAP